MNAGADPGVARDDPQRPHTRQSSDVEENTNIDGYKPWALDWASTLSLFPSFLPDDASDPHEVCVDNGSNSNLQFSSDSCSFVRPDDTEMTAGERGALVAPGEVSVCVVCMPSGFALNPTKT